MKNEASKLAIEIIETGIIQKELVREGLTQSKYQNRNHLTPLAIETRFRGVDVGFIEGYGLSYELDENNEEMYHPLTLAINASFRAIVIGQNYSSRIERLEKNRKLDDLYKQSVQNEVHRIIKRVNYKDKLSIGQIKRIQKRLRQLENERKKTTIRELVIEILNVIITRIKSKLKN